MAEAVAAVGVVASILQLVDFGTKLVERLDDFVTATKEVPEVFHNISVQLPLALSALQRLRTRVEKGELIESESKALKALVDHSLKLIKDVNTVLDKVLPPANASSLEKRLLAIRSLRYDKAVQNASTQLLQNVNLLTFFQTTHIHEDARNLAQRLGTVTTFQASQLGNFHHGLNLGGAPRLADGNFVGREIELGQLTHMLTPTARGQNVVAVVGMGGIGKTQLCIEYAVTNQDEYSSIFWLNAQDELSLRTDLLAVAGMILPEESKGLIARADEDSLIQKIRRWFSLPENSKWLVIFDNLDKPKVPGGRDATSIDIRDYFPHRSQGSILITTRSRQITFAKQLNLRKFEDVKQGLDLLSTRCGQCVDNDSDATSLVKRLDGLPLALASAASFLERTSFTAKEYLEEYEKNWLEEDSDCLLEYGDRTLFTTWNLSYDTIKGQNPEVTEIMRILAFFGNENIDRSLLVAREIFPWPSLRNSLRNEAAFHRSMAKLRDYSLVETSGRSYRLHPCVHDWALLNLNRDILQEDVSRALKCIVLSAKPGSTVWSANYDDSMSRLASHASRLMHPHIYCVLIEIEPNQEHALALSVLGQVLQRAGRNSEAMNILRLSLAWSQEHLGEDNPITLTTYNAIGLVFEALQDYTKAEILLQKSALGLSRTLGQHNQKTLDSVHNLALLYKRLDRFAEAQRMHMWSVAGCKEAYGPQDPNTFWAVMALADFYLAKGETNQAEKEFQRALDGFDSAIDHDHFFARFTASRLGVIYTQQEEYEKAVAMYERVYKSQVRVSGPDHWLTHEAQVDLERSKIASRDPELHSSTLSTLVRNSATERSNLAGGLTKSIVLDYHPLREEHRNRTQPLQLMEWVDLQCSKCGTHLTDETMRFICCTCKDHELCGKCYDTFRVEKSREHDSKSGIQVGKIATVHCFVRCEEATVPKYVLPTSQRVHIGIDFGTTFTGLDYLSSIKTSMGHTEGIAGPSSFAEAAVMVNTKLELEAQPSLLDELELLLGYLDSLPQSAQSASSSKAERTSR